MRRGPLVAAAAGVAIAAAATVGWVASGPAAMDFAGGRRVELAAYGGDPTGVPAGMRNAALAERGAYLARAADCEACHTAKGGAPFAGGLGFKLPFGTLYAPNITPDRETGIGTWSDGDFLRALREGVGPDGTHLYPAFPYPSYTLITDSDALAIKAYLFSLPTRRAGTPANTLKFPYNQRWLMAFWTALFNPNRRFQPAIERSPQWNRGAYLVEALGHCGECHTPRNLAQALDHRRKFAGAVAAGWSAYNITPDAAAGIGGWRDDELAKFLATGHAAGRGTASGPMGEAVDLSLSHLAPEDISAIVAYVRTVAPLASPDLPAPRAEPAPESHKAGPADAGGMGKAVFAGACIGCHAWSGEGTIASYATLTGGRAVNDPSGRNVVQAIVGGVNRRGGSGSRDMPAFGRGYSDREIAAVANYVTERFGARPASLTAADVASIRGEAAH